MGKLFAKGALLAVLSQQSKAACPISGSSEGSAGCPHHSGAGAKVRSANAANNLVRFKNPPRERSSQRHRVLAEGEIDFVYSNQREGEGGIPDGGYAAVREDLKALLTDSQDFWPADFNAPTGPNYGGLFIRLAWHCNGSYRHSDGRGGCDGGSILHDPVKSWPDNASLDMAIQVLQPIKTKYGEKLSWGDLIVLAGDTAIVTMGGPVIGFCGGRVDDTNGDESIPLGPSDEQQTFMPCGDLCPVGETCPGCESPLGAAEIGLIYVNPEGPDGQKGNLTAAAEGIRDVFGRMGFDDRLSVSVIGGGHAFGKCHGACVKDGPGFCPNGYTWEDKRTSGLELTWTTEPTKWTNQFFTNLVDFNWTQSTGPGGAIQYKPTNEGAPLIGMLVTDVALLRGDPEYEKLSREYAKDFNLLTKDFGEAWYQLMARDVGPRTRCSGDELPGDMQPWETASFVPLSFTEEDRDYVKVRTAIQESIDTKPENIPAFATLAVMCASTFRHTDYSGGCNGAPIRFSPQIDWETSAGASEALAEIEPIKNLFKDVSYADIIALAGQTAVEAAGGKRMPFCGGRNDAKNGEKSTGLEPKLWNNNTYASVMYAIKNTGMSLSEGIALKLGTPTVESSDFPMVEARDFGMVESPTLSNQVFVDLKANTPDSVYLQDDIGAVVEGFIADNDKFLTEYAKAFTYMITADLFDGSRSNACQDTDVPTLAAAPATDVSTPTETDASAPTETVASAPTESDTSGALSYFGTKPFSVAAIMSIFAFIMLCLQQSV